MATQGIPYPAVTTLSAPRRWQGIPSHPSPVGDWGVAGSHPDPLQGFGGRGSHIPAIHQLLCPSGKGRESHPVRGMGVPPSCNHLPPTWHGGPTPRHEGPHGGPGVTSHDRHPGRMQDHIPPLPRNHASGRPHIQPRGGHPASVGVLSGAGRRVGALQVVVTVRHLEVLRRHTRPTHTAHLVVGVTRRGVNVEQLEGCERHLLGPPTAVHEVEAGTLLPVGVHDQVLLRISVFLYDFK